MLNKIAALFVVTLICLINCATGKDSGNITLNGRVSDTNDQAVAGALINVLPNMENNNQRYYIVFPVKESVRTDTEGKYTLQFDPNGFGPVRGDFFDLYIRNLDHNLVAIKKFNKKNKIVNVTLSPGIILTGAIVDINDSPIPNASLSFIIPSMTTTCRFLFENNCPMSDENGRYEIIALWPEKRYSITAKAKDYAERSIDKYFIDDAPDHRIELEPIVLKKANMSISGVVLDNNGKPVADARVSCYGDGQPSRSTATDKEGKFTIEKICAGPIDIRIFKNDSKLIKPMSTRAKAEGGATGIKIILPPGQRQPLSLVGRHLPDIKDFKIAISPADAKDKSFLVCFFDMNQRPSRNCLLQMSKRAQELKAKDVVVVAVQVLKVDENKLNDWIKKNNIPFSIGMVQGDEEKIRFTWGVRSLPRLILTDRKHVVTAEGFALAELDEKLNSNSH